MTDFMPGSQISWESNVALPHIRLIGIGGKLRSGKDTVADYLVSNHGWIKMGMSDPLNEALLRQNPYIQVLPGEAGNVTGKRAKYWQYKDLIDTYGYVTAKTITDVRRNLMTLGTEVGRELIGPETWVSVADNMIFDHLADGKNVIITGIRFPNEIALINKYEAGETWYVKRPSLEEGELKGHASETSVGEADFSIVLDNDSTLDSLYATVDALLGQPRE